MSVASREEQDVCRHRFLRWVPLRRHVCDDDVQDPLKLRLLENEHLVVETAVPDELLLFLFVELSG